MFSYRLIRSRRRTLALEITKSCEVVVRAPMRCAQHTVDAFVAAHEDWVRVHLAAQARRASAPPPPTQEEIAALKKKAREILPEKVAFYAQEMGLTPTGVKITAARTRYGSCSGKNSLCFSCFLMNAPEPAIDLVVVHELCHIRHKNHGPQFYALLGSILPDYKERKKLLTMDK
ncbi:MAG: M48 family metallopeptidase [Oscillibacter sp.]|jgi:predicted metal-dependent hydrolase|nr:M48 family metallopeptidase [Oscillibacter sp.]